MSQFTRIGIDTSKAVFTLHCVDDAGQAVLRTNLRRAQMVPFFSKLSPTEIVIEACGVRSSDVIGTSASVRPLASSFTTTPRMRPESSHSASTRSFAVAGAARSTRT